MKNLYLFIPDLDQCGPPKRIKNGDFILSSTSGKLVAQYSCYHGFKLQGAATIVCEENQWSNKPPQCTGTLTISAMDFVSWHLFVMVSCKLAELFLLLSLLL